MFRRGLISIKLKSNLGVIRTAPSIIKQSIQSMAKTELRLGNPSLKYIDNSFTALKHETAKKTAIMSGKDIKRIVLLYKPNDQNTAKPIGISIGITNNRY